MFSFKPMPHDEAARRIAKLPIVSREVMEGLLPELRAHAFTVAGLSKASQMARVKKILEGVPAGENWDTAKRGVIAELRAAGITGKDAPRRAETLLRTTAFRAYAATRYQVLMRQTDVFPFWQYKTAGDGRVRPAHTALHNRIFPAGHEIWQRIFPPWGWGCRCLVVPLTKRGAEKAAQDAAVTEAENLNMPDHLQPLQKVKPVLHDTREADLISQSARLPGGISLEVEPSWGRAPWSEKGNLRPSWAYLESLYSEDPEAFAAFREWAGKTEIAKGQTVSMWIEGKAAKRAKSIKAPAVLPAAPAAPAVPLASSATAAEALQMAGISMDQRASAAQMRKLVAELKEDAPATAPIRVLRGLPSTGALAEDRVRAVIQEFVDLVPPQVVARLPDLAVSGCHAGDAFGSYSKGGILRLSVVLLRSEEKMRSTIFHELTHWVHRELPGDHPWVRKIKAHYEARTAGEPMITLPKYGSKGKRDKWYEEYAGRIYGFREESTHLGLEFPTRHLELLSDPAKLARVWSSSQEARDDIALSLEGLYL